MTERKACKECQKLDVDLPVLKSEEESRDLANLMGKIEEPWLAMEVTGNNDLKWIDCTSVSATFSAWNTGEPNNPGVENCAYSTCTWSRTRKEREIKIPAWMQCTVLFVRKRSKIIDFSA